MSLLDEKKESRAARRPEALKKKAPTSPCSAGEGDRLNYPQKRKGGARPGDP